MRVAGRGTSGGAKDCVGKNDNVLFDCFRKDELKHTVSANVAMATRFHDQKVITMLRRIVPISQDQVRFGADDSDSAMKVDSGKIQPMWLAEDAHTMIRATGLMVFQSITMIDEKFG
ncbi:hypothetical protein IV203_023475 [Nitzschia inconspicua]|uniref:Uncharacterized protein n=1 Tax=Nitzschia inconspicua TaxID=303405 RepID=A0A9K3KEH0_9STRA|nr:hypothetical protein IV203_023475 [Nitzschia inconspicua]